MEITIRPTGTNSWCNTQSCQKVTFCWDIVTRNFFFWGQHVGVPFWGLILHQRLYAKIHAASPLMISNVRGLFLTLIIQGCCTPTPTWTQLYTHMHAHMCVLILCGDKYSFRMQWTDPCDTPILFPICSIISINLMSQFYELWSHIHCSLMLLCTSVAPVAHSRFIKASPP